MADQDHSFDLQNLNPVFGQKMSVMLADAKAAGINPGNIISGYRSVANQTEIYARSHQGRDFPAAAPGDSMHNFGMAVDINSPDITKLRAFANAHPEYGIYPLPGDTPHFQLAGNQHALMANPPSLPGGASFDSVSALSPYVGSGYSLINDNLKYASSPGTTINTTGPSRPVTPTPGPTLFAGVNPNALGMRNNNPGNLVSSDWVKGLPGYKGVNGGFAVFDTPEHGAAALDANLVSYGNKGINTPLGIASTWAPASDPRNNPNSYGAQIAKGLGVGPNDKIDLTDPTVRNKIANSIALVENGPGKSSGVQVPYAGSGGTGTSQPAQQNAVGNAIAALTKGAGGQGDSDLASTLMGKSSQFGPAGGGTPVGDQGQGLQLQQAAGMGNQRQQLIQMQAQQLAAQLQQRAQQPLAWGSAPYGAGAGQQQPTMPMAGQLPPGVTLNSMGGSYV